jgi:hypothetical protein
MRWNKKSNKSAIKIEMTTFLGNNAASNIKKARFCTTLFTVLNKVWTLDPVLDLEPELGMEPETKLEPDL